MIKKINDIYIDGGLNNGTTVNHTGTLTNTLVDGILIPANTFVSGDTVVLDGSFSKDLTNGTYTVRYYWNTAYSLSSPAALLLATRLFSATQLYGTVYRTLSIRTANGGGSGIHLGTELLQTTLTNSYELNSSANIANVAIDWTTDGYFLCAIQLANTSDTVSKQSMKIWTY